MRRRDLIQPFRSVETHCGQRGGFALVMVLAILVLMLAVALAFFSKAQLNRMTSASSAANQQVEILTDSAVTLVVGDLIHEIAAGSEDDSLAGTLPENARKHLQPILLDTPVGLLGRSELVISTAPSMVPQRVVADEASAPRVLLKQSLRDRPFFATGPGVTNAAPLPSVPNRAAAVNTEDPAQGGVRMSPDRWAKPALARADETVASPDWVYLNRAGSTPTAFSDAWRERDSANPDYIVGRFAFNIFDVGGLIDVNVVGNVLSAVENANRGRLHQVSLANAPGDLQIPDFENFVAWRSSGDNVATTEAGGLFDPKRTFKDVIPGSQALVTRQDLLKYVDAESTIPTAALPFLTTFSREFNAPTYAPEPGRPMLPIGAAGDSTPDQLNPGLSAIRFDEETTLSRGSGPAVTVAAGTPVMARRFPLSKLDLLTEDSSTANDLDLEYYFGLERQPDGSLRYIAASADGRIKRLEEIRTEAREPNFFEVLQATIITGSLGRNGGNTNTIDQPRDQLRNLQVVQIGANIIDQWDEDDFPSAVAYPSGNPGEWEMSYGTENLPYINTMEFAAFHPAWDRDRLQIWALFSVWNPHQDAERPAEGIGDFRIHPASGSMKATFGYVLRTDNEEYSDPQGNLQILPKDFFALGEYRGTLNQEVAALNAGREFVFPNDGSYGEPRVIGANEPTSEDDAAGILLNELTHDPNDTDVEYLAPVVPIDPLEMDEATRNGYTAVTTTKTVYLPGVNQLLAAEGRSPVPPDGDGYFGPKTFNYFRLFGLRGDRPVLHLQYRKSGSDQWQTYQIVDSLFPNSNEPDPFTGDSAGSTTVTNYREHYRGEIDRVSLHSAPGWDASRDHSFYSWRYDDVTSGYDRTFFGAFKFDPRTIRFGHSDHPHETLGTEGNLRGRTIRSAIAEPNWALKAGFLRQNVNWMVTGSGGMAGSFSGPTDRMSFDPDAYEGFEWFNVGTNLRTPMGFIRNIPEGTLSREVNPSRYADRDGIIRPADGYLGAIPTISPVASSGVGSIADRPIILNRPFRSVGELGYVFRDVPWKTIDFFTRNSGDLGLLDAFSLDEPGDRLPVVAGKVNLNSASAEVLQAILQDTGKTIDAAEIISATDAESIATAIVAEREANGPFRDPGDLVSRVLSPDGLDSVGVMADVRKHEREAAIRVLSEIGTTRTWNLLIDMIVQVGRIAPNAADASDFVVRAERRVWVHLALDRLTGEVVDQKWEVVDE